MDHIKSKKGLLHAFIQELEVIPPQRPEVDLTRQGVFFAGQTFDALSLAARIFATAKTRLLLIDGYIGADTLNILPTTGIQIDIFTKPPLSATVKTLCQAFKAQHGSLTVKTSSAFHDRFLVIDNVPPYITLERPSRIWAKRPLCFPGSRSRKSLRRSMPSWVQNGAALRSKCEVAIRGL